MKLDKTDAQKAIETARAVRAVVVEVECPHCHGKRRLPGGKYADQGEVVNCAACSGRGTVRSSIPLGMLYDLLNGNITAARPTTQGAALFEYVPVEEELCGGAAMDFTLTPGMQIQGVGRCCKNCRNLIGATPHADGEGYTSFGGFTSDELKPLNDEAHAMLKLVLPKVRE